jgi:hypothetical protein
MIVRVSLRDAGRVALVHDRKREHIQHMVLSRDTLKALDGRTEAFFSADVEHDSIKLLNRVPDPGWV